MTGPIRGFTVVTLLLVLTAAGCGEDDASRPPFVVEGLGVVIADGARYAAQDPVRLTIRGEAGDVCHVRNVTPSGGEDRVVALQDSVAVIEGWDLEPGDGPRIVEAAFIRDGDPVGAARDTIIVDTTPPRMAADWLVAPADTSFAGTNLQLRWRAAEDSLCPGRDIRYIVTLSRARADTLVRAVVRDTAAAIINLAPGTEYELSAVPVDSAGNVGIAARRMLRTWDLGVASLARIPAGAFEMGSPTTEPTRKIDEPLHHVVISHTKGFAHTELTVDDYVAALNAALERGYVEVSDPYVYDALGASRVELWDMKWAAFEYVGGAFVRRSEIPGNSLVNTISWYGSAAYCDWLNLLGGSEQRLSRDAEWLLVGPLDAEGYRLPTEAEWEYACRAGTSTAFYSGDITGYGCCTGDGPCCCGDAALALVGYYCGNASSWDFTGHTKWPNEWTIFDMHGGYSDWCYDVYALDPVVAVEDPVVESGTVLRVRRGNRPGAVGDPGDCRSAARWSGHPDYGIDYATMRLVWCWEGPLLRQGRP